MTNLMLPGFEDLEPKPPNTMPELKAAAAVCTKCRLHETRTQVTWSQGDPNSPLMIVAMGPSVTDDKTGGIYTGPAGDVLDQMLGEAGLSRDVIYLTNAHKCVAHKKDDPFNIRYPTKGELAACQFWLDGEFQIVKPKILLMIGSPTAKWLLGDDFNLTEQRGQWQKGPFNTQAMATFQPTYVSRLRQNGAPDAEDVYELVVNDMKRCGAAAGLI